MFQGQKKTMGTKNVHKTKSYVTKEKFFKSMNGLQRNFRKCILKNSPFFAIIPKLRPKQKMIRVKLDPLSPLKIFTLKTGTLGIYVHVKKHSGTVR